MNPKEKIFNLIDNQNGKTFWNQYFDTFIVSLIILSIVEIILESFQELALKYSTVFRAFEIFTVLVFTIEYLLRVWTANLKYPQMSKTSARLKFIFSATGLIDLIAILPFYLPFLFRFDLRVIRILRVVRLLRVLKLNRYTKAFTIVLEVFRQKRAELTITLFVTSVLLLLSSTIMYNLENEAQPDKFPNIISTFWWAVATLTTVGYGDVFPVTGWGKLMSGIIALLGIGLVALPAGIISSGFIERLEGPKKGKPVKAAHPDHKYCPCCGRELEKISKEQQLPEI